MMGLDVPRSNLSVTGTAELWSDRMTGIYGACRMSVVRKVKKKRTVY